jgi:uncharacterized LabA/DUF88 family protein
MCGEEAHMATINDNFFFIDGSALIADVNAYRREHAPLETMKFRIQGIVDYMTGSRLRHLHGDSFKRFVFYFAVRDERVNEIFELPDISMPGQGTDTYIQYCGKRLRKSKRVEEWISEHKPPPAVMDKLHRSEKAVDTQICCDALQLAAYNKLNRLFLYANDSDFLPLFGALRQCGANISLIRLFAKGTNKELLKECDSFDVMGETILEKCFV